MADKFGLNIDYDPQESVDFLTNIGVLKKSIEGMVYIQNSMVLTHTSGNRPGIS